MTSDILVVCEVGNEFRICKILYYDGHFDGNTKSNVIVEKLLSNTRLFCESDICFFREE